MPSLSYADPSFIDIITKKLRWSKGAELQIWCKKKQLDYDWHKSVSYSKYRSIAMDKVTYVMLLYLGEHDEDLFWATVEELIRQTGDLDGEVEQLLASKGKKWEGGGLKPRRPLMLNPIEQMDSLQILHKQLGFPEVFMREIREAYESYTVKNDPKSALDRYRTALEKLLEYIAAYAINHHPNGNKVKVDLKRPVSVRQCLRSLDFLHEKEKAMVDSFYGWVSSTSTHQWSWLANPSSVEYVMVTLPAWFALFSERFRDYKNSFP